MSNQNFLTISRGECLMVYKEIIKNSDQKWESGKMLAQQGDFGNAISLSIISVEELIKATLLFLDGNGFEFRSVKGMKALFTDHEIRYFIAYAMFVLGIFGDDLRKLLLKIKENPDDSMKKIQLMTTGDMQTNVKLKYYLIRKFIELKKELVWFSKVDVFRQDGFYCDYEQQLKNPIKISQSEYEVVIKKLDKVRFIGKEFIGAFQLEDSELVKMYAKMKKEFKEKGYYSKIGNVLTLVKNGKGPFKLVMSKTY